MSQSHLRSVDEQSTISSTDGGCCGKALCCVDKGYIYLGRANWLRICPAFTLSRCNTSPTDHCQLLNIPIETPVVRRCTPLWSLLIGQDFYSFSQQWFYQPSWFCFFALEDAVEFKKELRLSFIFVMSDCCKCSNHRGSWWKAVAGVICTTRGS